MSLEAAIATDPGNIWMQPRGVIAKVEAFGLPGNE
jgi:hypothetical protein